MAVQDGSNDPPEIAILLLGDAGVGKSTFLSRMTVPPQSIPRGQSPSLLRDLDQPFPFNVRFQHNQFRLEFYDTSSPQSYVLLRPAVIVLCYSIGDIPSLRSVQSKWKHMVETHFNYDESLPVILLGLQRDVRSIEDYGGTVKLKAANGDEEREGLTARTFVYPQEALMAAQEMRLDRYCECSALTGELCQEAFEDICRTAASTLKASGGKSTGTQCCVM